MTKFLNFFLQSLRNIKNSTSIKFNFFKYNIAFIKRINGYIAARKLIFHSGLIFSFTKNIFITHSFRPFNANDINNRPVDKKLSNDCCIIIQGPIKIEDNFTLETIKLYIKLHKNSLIILSTWSDTPEEILSVFRELNIKLILNQKPQNPGWSHINFQMLSVHSAIQYAKKMNLKYIAKTRTDCRVYSPVFLVYCKTILKQYPSYSNTKNRIISSDFSSKHMIYGLDDKFQFGFIDEMEIFWNYVPWEDEIKNKFDNQKVINETPVVCEFFLTARYLKELNIFSKWDLSSWWLSLKNNFIIIDSSSIDLFFYKYDYYFEQRFYRAYGSEYQKSITYSDWLLLYSDIIPSWDFEDGKTIQRWKLDKFGEIKKIK